MAKRKRTPGEGTQRRKPSESLPDELPASLDWRAVDASLPRIMAGSVRSSANLARAQAIVYDAFDAEFEEQVSLALQALDISPDCADAYVVLAEHASSLDEALDLYRQGVEAGQRAIGKAFREHEGAFWKFFETRSYLRARLGWAVCLWDSAQYDEAIENYREILRLNPQDQQGIRYLLASALLDLGRDDELEQLFARYPKDGRAEWLYAAALLAYRKQGDSPHARQLLLKAVKRNRYVPECLLDFRHAPVDLPDDAEQGSREEAVGCAAHARLAWRSTPQAIAWFRKVLQIPVLPPPVTRARDWRRLQRLLDELPQAQGEVWQVDSRQFAEKIEIEGSAARPWLIVVADQSRAAFLAVEAGEGKPTPADAWHHLVEAMLKPRLGDPRRPQKVLVRLKSYQTAWQKKLAQIGVACEVGESLEMVEMAVTQTRIAQAADRRAPHSPPHGADDQTDPRSLPQEIGETWQTDVRRLLGWVEDGGEVLRPCGLIVVQRGSEQVLGYDLAVRTAPPDWLWQTVARAMCGPLRGQPHRPGIIEVVSEEQRAALQPHLDACGIRCVVAGRDDRLDAICEEMSRSLNRPVSMTALVDVPGVSREQVAAFYAAAAEYYRSMPWRRVSGHVPIEVDCDKFQSGPWYAVVLGQYGITLGLALYEGLGDIETALSAAAEAERARRTSAITVTFGEAFELPIRDLEAAERGCWPLASPDAYPCAMRVNPGRTVRPLLAWELELLEGCLRTIPNFVAEEAWESVRTVSVATGELTLQLAWIAEDDD